MGGPHGCCGGHPPGVMGSILQRYSLQKYLQIDSSLLVTTS